jgi:hypothetical protein
LTGDSKLVAEEELRMTNGADHVVKLKEAYRLWDEIKGGSAEHWAGLFADATCGIFGRGRPSTS